MPANALFLVLIAVMFYVLLVRGPRQRVRRQQAALAQLEVGDEVVTIGGIVGRIAAFEGERIVVEISPGVPVTFLRAGVRNKVSPVPEDEGERSDPADADRRGAAEPDDGHRGPDRDDQGERRDGAA